ncbi:MAG: ATP-binding protein [Chloroflexi bacterium]|nr:ATP-binding protein [Chloroflexota bacterium]
MSIRFRLTLLYSIILALTLIAFSTILYATQSRATYDAIASSLTHQAQELILHARRQPRRSGQVANSTLPGRWTQIRNPDGTVVSRTGDLGDTTLPLSVAGLQAVKAGQSWTETAQVESEPLLVYSVPVVVDNQVTQIIQVATPTTERAQSLGTLRLILIIGSLFVILAAFVIGWVLAGAALRPIHRITHTAQAIGAEKDFSRRVEHSGPNDEVGQLATTFNIMLTELESAYRQVEQALQAQRRFVADASHELRTPLTTIRGNIELLHHDRPMDAKEQLDVLTDTRDEVERLIRLVKQLLVLARSDAGRQLRREPVPIKPLLEDVYRQAKLLAPRRTIQCDASLDATVLGDRDALKEVLVILLENAIAHTPSHAAIGLGAAQADGHVSISIQDTGPGIAPNLLPHIFERFFRGSSSRTGAGSGLGLAIAKELVDAQEGALIVESQIGQGSVFTVKLPQVQTAPLTSD